MCNDLFKCSRFRVKHDARYDRGGFSSWFDQYELYLQWAGRQTTQGSGRDERVVLTTDALKNVRIWGRVLSLAWPFEVRVRIVRGFTIEYFPRASTARLKARLALAWLVQCPERLERQKLSDSTYKRSRV